MNFKLNFQKENKIIWIYGKSGYGKTYFAKNIAKEFKRVCFLNFNSFLSYYLKLLEKNSSENSKNLIASFYKRCDLLVLDDIDLSIYNKPKTQKDIKEILSLIIKNTETKIILVSNKKPGKIKALKFNLDDCVYFRLKEPDLDYKVSLLKKWACERNMNISKLKFYNIAKLSNNLFELKGILNYLKLS